MKPIVPGLSSSYATGNLLLAVLAALVIHEMGHALAARAQGIGMRSEYAGGAGGGRRPAVVHRAFSRCCVDRWKWTSILQ
jgi:hypothetical protein